MSASLFPKKIYTVTLAVTANEGEYRRFKTMVETLPTVSNFKLLKTEDVETVVKYPANGAKTLSTVRLTFEKKVSKDQVEQVVEYWNSIGYVQGASNVDWVGNEASFRFNPTKSGSHDINSRNILELLLKFLEEGTPVRQNFPFGQAFAGLGKGSVKQILGF